jgi:hypothetical protein
MPSIVVARDSAEVGRTIAAMDGPEAKTIRLAVSRTSNVLNLKGVVRSAEQSLKASPNQDMVLYSSDCLLHTLFIGVTASAAEKAASEPDRDFKWSHHLQLVEPFHESVGGAFL